MGLPVHPRGVQGSQDTTGHRAQVLVPVPPATPQSHEEVGFLPTTALGAPELLGQVCRHRTATGF